ncbi:MAG: hypothetical protein HY670_07635 [Chloroflexi bacterium]|nr:hypothetical protein [Chloroflexota bacterium]
MGNPLSVVSLNIYIPQLQARGVDVVYDMPVVVPTIALTPPTGPPGTTVTVSGTGFAANEADITLTYDGTVLISGIAANSQGSWSETFTVPLSPHGAHTVSAYGAITAATTATFTIPQAIVISLDANPATPIAGEVVTASGVTKDEDGAILSVVTVSIDWGDGSTDEVTSGADGAYTSTHAYTLPGSYHVEATASKTGYLNGSAGKDITVSVPPTIDITLNITPAAPTTATPVTTSGTTNDQAGNVVVGVTVDVTWGDGATSQVFSDGIGNYTASHTYTQAGPYTITVTGNKTGYLPGSKSADIVVNVPKAVIMSVNITPAAPQVGEELTASGVTMDQNGAPLSGVTVLIDWGDGSTAETTSDADGAYSVTHTYTAAGVYTVDVTGNKLGYISGQASCDILVSVAKAITPTLELNPPEPVVGQQVTASGITSDQDEAPLPDVTVTVDWGDGTITQTTSGAGGAYASTHTYTSAGDYTLSVVGAKLGYASGSRSQPIVVEVRPTVQISLGLSPTPGIKGEPVTASGVTTDQDGNPLSGVTVTIEWGDGATDQMVTASHYSFTHTYTTVGDFEVRVTGTKTGYDPSSASVALKVAVPPPILISLDVDPATPLAGEVVTASGVTRDEDGAMLSGVTVSIDWGDGSNAETTSDADGAYSFTYTYAIAGDYVAHVTGAKSGYSSFSVSVHVLVSVSGLSISLSVSAATPQTWPLQPGWSVTASGVTKDQDGNPLGQAFVSIDWGDQAATMLNSDEDGTYSVTHIYVTGRSYTVTATAMKNLYASPSTSEEVLVTLPHIVTSLEVTPPAPVVDQRVTASGVTRHEDGAPTSEVFVTMDWGDGTTQYTMSDASGEYLFTHSYPASGRYTAKAIGTKGYYLKGTSSAGIVIDVPMAVAIALDTSPASPVPGQAVSVSGVTRDGEGNILPEVTLAVDWGDGTTDQMTSGSDGRYAFSHAYVSEGNYGLVVMASKAGYLDASSLADITVAVALPPLLPPLPPGGGGFGVPPAPPPSGVLPPSGWEWQNPLPHGNPFYDIWGSSSSDVFAVGSGGTILHYDGTSWSEMTSGTMDTLLAAWGSSASDVFAIGDRGTILHYDGTSWSEMDTGTTGTLFDVWGSSASDVFAVGSSGTILHYDGTSWSQMSSGTMDTLLAAWGSSASDVFAIGSGGTILHYGGASWTLMDSGTSNSLYGVWGNSSSDVFAVGEWGTVLHYDTGSWEWMGSITTTGLYGVWGSSSSDVFAVGSDGTILHYDGTSWSQMASGTTNSLYGVWGSSASDVFAVGLGGIILHYDGTSWSEMASGTANWFYGGRYGVWGSSSSDVFVVGSAILHYDGSSWSQMVGGNGSLQDVWGSSSSDVFAVGPWGIWHYNGSSWNVMPNVTGNSLHGLWGTSGSDVFAVGDGDTILHYGVVAGDANSDGQVTATDITAVERIIAVMDPATAGADANRDGKINALDITRTEMIVAGLG